MVNWTDTLYSEGCLLFYDRDKKMVVGLGGYNENFSRVMVVFQTGKKVLHNGGSAAHDRGSIRTSPA